MNFYKKLIRSQKCRYRLIYFFRFIPDKWMLKFQYFLKTGRSLNIKKPKRFTEKIQLYKLFYRNDLMTICSDKYEVRNYIKSKGLEDILVPIYKVYDNPKDIEVSSLPNKFIIKTNNGSNTNFICRDKTQFDLDLSIEKLDYWLRRARKIKAGREWCYYNIKPKIVIEEFLEDSANGNSGIDDYKFICFNGKPSFIVLDVDRFVHHKRNIYDLNWNNLNIGTDCDSYNEKVSPPKKLKEMIKIAEILSKDFPFVRVDLYLVNGKIYFGEMTFYPWSGYVIFKPDDFDFLLGGKFDIY